MICATLYQEQGGDFALRLRGVYKIAGQPFMLRFLDKGNFSSPEEARQYSTRKGWIFTRVRRQG